MLSEKVGLFWSILETFASDALHDMTLWLRDMVERWLVFDRRTYSLRCARPTADR